MGKRRKTAALLSGAEDAVESRLADALDAEESVPYLAFHYGEDLRALVDVGRQDGHPALPALGDVLDEAVRVVHLVREDGRHEGQVVMRLQIGCLVGDEGVGGAVRFIEAVLAEPQDDVVDLPRRLQASPRSRRTLA